MTSGSGVFYLKMLGEGTILLHHICFVLSASDVAHCQAHDIG